MGKTTIKPTILNMINEKVLFLSIKNAEIVNVSHNPDATNIAIHNLTIDDLVKFSTEIQKAIDQEVTREINFIGSIPHDSERERIY